MSTTKVANLVKMANLAKVADLKKFRHTLRFDLKGWAQFESGKFGESGESDGFDKISPHVKIRLNDLKGWVQSKW